MELRLVNGGIGNGGSGVDHGGYASVVFASVGLPQDGAQTTEAQHGGGIDAGYGSDLQDV